VPVHAPDECEEPPRHSNKQPLGLLHVMGMKEPRRNWSERGSSHGGRSRKPVGQTLRTKITPNSVGRFHWPSLL
jgi:hypothetical protein